MSYTAHTLLGCVLLLASLPVEAQVTSIDYCPFFITQSGEYHVTRDLTCPADGGIHIDADNVRLHLDGHTLDGLGVGAIGLLIIGSNNSVFGSGTVKNFQFNIFLGDPALLETPVGNRLANITAAGSSGPGILVTNSIQNAIINCTFTNNAYGIYLGIGSSRNAFISNTARGNEFAGILVVYSDNVLLGNQTDGNQYGIQVEVSSSRNAILANKAHHNTTYDLDDDNAACDDNVWKSNSFGTANRRCIH